MPPEGARGSVRSTSPLALLLFVVATGALAAAFASGSLRASVPFDFRTFYCGAETASAGADPYLVEPVRACERRLPSTLPPAYFFPSVVPPYDFAFLRPLARLDMTDAYECWIVVTLVFFAATVLGLRAIGGASAFAIFGVLLVPDLGVSTYLGQIAPVVVGFAVLAAWALASGRPALAGALVAATCVEPHMGVPAALGVACFVPRARLALGTSLAALAAISLAELPVAQNVAYVSVVLGANVRAELASHAQFSLAALLALGGAPAAIAIAGGAASTALVLATGLVALRRLASGPRDPIVVLLPFALAPVGGAFVHVTQLCCALPFLVLLAAREVAPRVRYPAALALALVGFPWIGLLGAGAADTAAVAAGVVAAAATLGVARLAVARAAGIIALCTGLALAIHAIGAPLADLAVLAPPLAPVDPRAYASVAWRSVVDAIFAGDGPRYLAARAPSWIGLLAMLVAIARAWRGARDLRPPSASASPAS